MRRAKLHALVLALACAWPTAAYPWTLDALLRLPLEQLLRLAVSVPAGIAPPLPGATGQNGGRR